MDVSICSFCSLPPPKNGKGGIRRFKVARHASTSPDR
jgi:hypothetical protein